MAPLGNIVNLDCDLGLFILAKQRLRIIWVISINRLGIKSSEREELFKSKGSAGTSANGDIAVMNKSRLKIRRFLIIKAVTSGNSLAWWEQKTRKSLAVALSAWEQGYMMWLTDCKGQWTQEILPPLSPQYGYFQRARNALWDWEDRFD